MCHHININVVGGWIYDDFRFTHSHFGTYQYDWSDEGFGRKRLVHQKIFLYQSLFGRQRMLIGNVIGVNLPYPNLTGVLHRSDVYYVDTVPMHLTLLSWLLTNVFTFIVLMLMIIEYLYYYKISPAKSIRLNKKGFYHKKKELLTSEIVYIFYKLFLFKTKF